MPAPWCSSPPSTRAPPASVAIGSRTPISVTVARGSADQITKEAVANGPAGRADRSEARWWANTRSRVGDEVVATVPLVALAKVDEGGIWRSAVDSVKLWFE